MKKIKKFYRIFLAIVCLLLIGYLTGYIIKVITGEPSTFWTRFAIVGNWLLLILVLYSMYLDWRKRQVLSFKKTMHDLINHVTFHEPLTKLDLIMLGYTKWNVDDYNAHGMQWRDDVVFYSDDNIKLQHQIIVMFDKNKFNYVFYGKEITFIESNVSAAWFIAFNTLTHRDNCNMDEVNRIINEIY